MINKIATPTESKKIMEKHGLHHKKSLGQNFIVEANIIEKIVKAAALTRRDIAVEIGPGLGALTQGLAEAAGQVLAMEIDKTLVPVLQELFADVPHVHIEHGDALKADFNALTLPLRAQGNYEEGFVIVANLPYYITTPLMMHFLESSFPWRRQVLMVQKEVAQRVMAKAGTKEYGALSLAVQYRAEVEMAFTVPPNVFYPKPKVDSAVMILKRLPGPPVFLKDEALFFAVIKAAFGQRRKTLNNALAAGLNLEKAMLADIFAETGIAASRRGETLSIQEFASLANTLFEKK